MRELLGYLLFGLGALLVRAGLRRLPRDVAAPHAALLAGRLVDETPLPEEPLSADEQERMRSGVARGIAKRRPRATALVGFLPGTERPQ